MRNDPETCPGQGGISNVLGSSRLIYRVYTVACSVVYETGTSKYASDAPLTWTRFWIIPFLAFPVISVIIIIIIIIIIINDNNNSINDNYYYY